MIAVGLNGVHLYTFRLKALTSPFEKGGLRGIYLIKYPPPLFFKEVV